MKKPRKTQLSVKEKMLLGSASKAIKELGKQNGKVFGQIPSLFFLSPSPRPTILYRKYIHG